MARAWFDEHPVGRRLLALMLVTVGIFVTNSIVQRRLLGHVSIGGQLYAEEREHTEARQEVTELSADIQGAQGVLAELAVARSPEHARAVLQSYAEQISGVDARFVEALEAPGLESAAPVLRSARNNWAGYEEAARSKLLRPGPPPSREELLPFLDGRESRRYARILGQLEAAENALKLEEAADEEESAEAVAHGQLLLDVLNGGLGLVLVLYLRRSARSMTRALAREAQQAHFEALRADISSALSGDGSLAEALRRCAESLARHLDAPLARIWLVGAGDKGLELQGSAGSAAPPGSTSVPLASEQGELGRIVRELRPYTSADVPNDRRLGLADWARREDIAGFAGLPLRVGNRPVGVLELYGAEPISEATVAALGVVADTLAQGIERSRAEQTRAAYAAELERSNAELERFAYVASHDLQEPLRMVSSYTQLLARRYKGKLDADADEFIHFTVDAVARMQRLLRDLLTYSRVGIQQKELVPTSSKQVFERAVSNLQAAVRESGATVDAGDLPMVMGDEVQLEQLFQNLVGNGLKFKGDKPPEVRVSAEPRENGEWLFAVKDNGIGIAPEHFQKLFVIFQRLSSASEYPGTGLGLAICKKIVERHGGRIWVESTPGQGATFFFTLKGAPASREQPRASA